MRVDARGMRCPWPALRAAKAMRSADAVLLLADDPRAASELAALAAEHGWSIESPTDHPVTTFVLRRIS